MKAADLTEFLIKSITKDPSSISVKGFDTEDYYVVEVLVAEEDMGTIIGRGGATINAIRTIVQASAYANHEKKVKINVDTI